MSRHPQSLLCFLVVVGTILANVLYADHHEELAKPKDEAAAKQEKGFVNLLGNNAQQEWVGYNKDKWPENWQLADGVLTRTGGGGDIMTTKKYDNFDFRFEWKISAGGNSGVQYLVSTGYRHPYETGLEYQVLDNQRHPDGKSKKTSAGALYAMYPPTKDAAKPAGKWNAGRIVKRGNHIRHFLNGKKIVDARLGSDQWNRRLKESKFATWEKFAKNSTGHIALQDHGNEVGYRHLRIKPLKAKNKAD